MELISIIMPAYNAEQFIEESIKSVIGQSYQRWELLIINDGSTDNTAAIGNKYVLLDSRIKLINQKNARLGAARNTGIRNAAGTWIAFLDSDDLWHDNKLEKQILISQQFPKASVIYTSGSVFNGNDLSVTVPYDIITGQFGPDEMYKLQYQRNYIPVLSAMVKKEWVDKVGFQEEVIQCCEDWDYWLRLATQGATFYGMDMPLFFYRRHLHNMSGNAINMHLAQVAIFIKNYRRNFFSRRETRQIFIPLINWLILNLINADRKEDAVKVVDSIKDVLPGFAVMYQVMLKLNNKATIKIFDILNRGYRKVKRTVKRNAN